MPPSSTVGGGLSDTKHVSFEYIVQAGFAGELISAVQLEAARSSSVAMVVDELRLFGRNSVKNSYNAVNDGEYHPPPARADWLCSISPQY